MELLSIHGALVYFCGSCGETSPFSNRKKMTEGEWKTTYFLPHAELFSTKFLYSCCLCGCFTFNCCSTQLLISPRKALFRRKKTCLIAAFKARETLREFLKPKSSQCYVSNVYSSWRQYSYSHGGCFWNTYIFSS